MPSWRVLYVQSRYEFKIAQQFERLGIVHYLPKLEVYRKWSDRIKKLQVPAFPSYLFVRNEYKDRNVVFQASGVLHYLRQDNRDATLREEEILLLRDCRELIVPSGFQPYSLTIGQRVLIKRGLLAGQRGVLVDWAGKKAVQIKLDQIAMGFLVQLPPEDLQVC